MTWKQQFHKMKEKYIWQILKTENILLIKLIRRSQESPSVIIFMINVEEDCFLIKRWILLRFRLNNNDHKLKKLCLPIWPFLTPPWQEFSHSLLLSGEGRGLVVPWPLLKWTGSQSCLWRIACNSSCVCCLYFISYPYLLFVPIPLTLFSYR